MNKLALYFVHTNILLGSFSGLIAVEAPHAYRQWFPCSDQTEERCFIRVFISSSPFKPKYQITYSPFLSPYMSYSSSGEKLLKYQENLT